MICKECGEREAKPNYRGLCAPCRTQRYAYSKGKKCVDCGTLITNCATRCADCAPKQRRRRKKLVCDWCDDIFAAKPHESRRFCSRECTYRYNASRMTTVKNQRPTIACKQCGEQFQPPAYLDQKFCSMDCYSNWRSENWSGKNHPRWKGPAILTCEVCGEEYERKQVEADDSRCCSYECYYDLHSQIMSGDGNPNWQGGHDSYRGESWNQQRRKARMRADGVCENCGKTRQENGRRLSIHHIVPFRKFGLENHLKANKLSNLIALCDVCHARAERGSITVSR